MQRDQSVAMSSPLRDPPQVKLTMPSEGFPDEPAFAYQPFSGHEEQFRFTPETFDRVIRDYNTKDLAI